MNPSTPPATPDVVTGMSPAPQRLSHLSRVEALRRLRSVPIGRLVFTVAGLPMIRPVNHAVDGDGIVIRTNPGSGPSLAAGAVVAYEADQIDPDTHRGWSVIVTGRAWIVDDLEQLERYEKLLRSWVAQDASQVLRIEAELVTGYALGDDER